jgi:hypothetical protein
MTNDSKSPTTRLAHAQAYTIKESLGGGFRGVAQNLLTGEVLKSEVCATLHEAKNAAKGYVFGWAAGRNWVTGSYPYSRDQWKMNYFIRTDEV